AATSAVRTRHDLPQSREASFESSAFGWRVSMPAQKSVRPDGAYQSAKSQLRTSRGPRPRGQPSTRGPPFCRRPAPRGYTRRVTATNRPPSTRGREPADPDGVLDMDPAAFRAAAHEVVDLMADYLENIEQYAVF